MPAAGGFSLDRFSPNLLESLAGIKLHVAESKTLVGTKTLCRGGWRGDTRGKCGSQRRRFARLLRQRCVDFVFAVTPRLNFSRIRLNSLSS